MARVASSSSYLLVVWACRLRAAFELVQPLALPTSTNEFHETALNSLNLNRGPSILRRLCVGLSSLAGAVMASPPTSAFGTLSSPNFSLTVIGNQLGTLFFGLVVARYLDYVQRYPKDSCWLKLSVGGIFLTSTAMWATATARLTLGLGKHYGDIAYVSAALSLVAEAED